jgi:hypothetical protein
VFHLGQSAQLFKNPSHTDIEVFLEEVGGSHSDLLESIYALS